MYSLGVGDSQSSPDEIFANAANNLINYAFTRQTNKKAIDLWREANQYNSAQAAAQRQFAADEAQKDRDFQALMSNTAYQRAVADMEAAGINPIMAVSNGGAGTPVGAAAQGSSAHSASTVSLDVPQFAKILQHTVTTSFKAGMSSAQ